MAPENFQRLRFGGTAGHPVGDARGHCMFDSAALFDGKRIGRRVFRDHADDFGLQAQCFAGCDHAADSRTQADGDVGHVQIRNRPEQFQRIGCDAVHQQWMERRHQVQPALSGDPRCAFARGLEVAAMLD